jgi:C-terminal processing protease CtpA/Prc
MSAIYDQVWSDIDRHYAFFEEKGIDWNAEYARYKPAADSATSMNTLAPVLGQLFSRLHDLHVDLTSSASRFDPTAHKQYVSVDTRQITTFFFPDLVLSRYVVAAKTTASKNISYGRIGQDIGYIWISGFGLESSWSGPEIDEALLTMNGVKGIIVDVRDNRGGSADAANTIASRFVEGTAIYAYVRYRNGPSHSDFTKFFPQKIGPAGIHQGVKTVILTNRLTASAAETFTLAARTNPKIVTVGDSTIGALGNPLVRELPDGWEYRFPEWVEVDAGMNRIENIGIAPDLYAPTDLTLLNKLRDSQLEQAIALIR